MQNAYLEVFNGRFRDECLSQHGFASLSHMRSVIDSWRDDYNHHQPHSPLGYVPPASSTRGRTTSLAAYRKAINDLDMPLA